MTKTSPLRIAVNGQMFQANSSLHRGMGRYSLALLRNLQLGSSVQIDVVANGAYGPLDKLGEVLTGAGLEGASVHEWHWHDPIAESRTSLSEVRAAERSFAKVIASLKPDLYLEPSIFEGFGEDICTTISEVAKLGVRTGALGYDLIPFIFHDLYLANPDTKSWYIRKLQEFRHADVVLSISKTTREDLIRYLGIAPRKVVTIMGAAAESGNLWRSNESSASRDPSMDVARPYVFSVLGQDPRKNVEGLVRAFSLIPKHVRSERSLVIACQLDPAEVDRLRSLASVHGVREEELQFMGHVSEWELAALYEHAELFVFPSKYEGLGMPVLEAMRYGTPVLVAGNSSLVELVPDPLYQMDYSSPEMMAIALARGLRNSKWLTEGAKYSRRQGRRFTWSKTAAVAEKAIREVVRGPITLSERQNLALVTPWPPHQTGIANYASHLAEGLAATYSLTVLVPNLHPDAEVVASTAGYSVLDLNGSVNALSSFDHRLYMVGNSPYHSEIVEVARAVPGVLDLHDPWIGGALVRVNDGVIDRRAFDREVLSSHGEYSFQESLQSDSPWETGSDWPASIGLCQQSLAVVVHSESASTIVRSHGYSGIMTVVPHLCAPLVLPDQETAKRRVGVSTDEVLIVSLGSSGRTKSSELLLKAFQASAPTLDVKARLAFVGQCERSDYGNRFSERARMGPTSDSVEITGWTSRGRYLDWVAAADVVVQLRDANTGEASGAVAEALAAGKAILVSDVGSLSEIPSNVALKLKQGDGPVELGRLLARLVESPSLRLTLGDNALAHAMCHLTLGETVDRYSSVFAATAARAT